MSTTISSARSALAVRPQNETDADPLLFGVFVTRYLHGGLRRRQLPSPG
jgi:hypothetical protein